MQQLNRVVARIDDARVKQRQPVIRDALDGRGHQAFPVSGAAKVPRDSGLRNQFPAVQIDGQERKGMRQHQLPCLSNRLPSLNQHH